MALPKKLDEIDERLTRIEQKLDSLLEVPARQPESMRVTQADLMTIGGIGESKADEILELLG